MSPVAFGGLQRSEGSCGRGKEKMGKGCVYQAGCTVSCLGNMSRNGNLAGGGLEEAKIGV